MTPRLRLILTIVVAAGLRFPGIEWGFSIEPGAYHQLHPDESVSCFDSWTRGRAWLDDPENWHERGMQVECWALSSLLRRAGGGDLAATTFVRAARIYSVLCGLAGILIIGLVARELDGDTATRALSGQCAALLCALAGAHIVTSFWARGQIQNNICFFGSIYLAQRALSGESKWWWLFCAGIAAGIAIGLRWSVELLPMLVIAALATHHRVVGLFACGFGCVLGFFGGTAFMWTPSQILTFIHMQAQAMLGLENVVGPTTIATAAVLCTIVGCGLATGVLGAWMPGNAGKGNTERLHRGLGRQAC